MSTDKKADFSGVTSSVDSTAQKVEKADFSGVTASVDSTAEKVGGTY
ncbi:MAG: peptidoglycan-binding protein LysM, partial [Stenotrophomonas sp.]